MGLNLTLDQGNTMTKLALWDASGNMVWSDVKLRLSPKDVADIIHANDITGAIYSSVRRERPIIAHVLKRKVPLAIDFTTSTPTPLKVAYATPKTLGPDRLAAAVGAYCLDGNKGKEILTVDLGTAITYDRVTADGTYIGGNIAPGITMRLRALHKSTARLPLIKLDRKEATRMPLFGTSTRTAILSGAIRGVVAELDYYRRNCAPESIIIITGGNAGLISPLLNFPHILEPDLVSKGLNEIIEYNK